jgi:stage III sporulation protein AH
MIPTSGDLDLASIGDAAFVNSGDVVDEGDETDKASSTSTQEQSNDVQTSQEADIVNATSKEDSEYFTSSKLQRDTMYSQMIESYQKMLDSTTITAEQKAIAKNAIMISENLIKTKGFKDVIILVNDKSINVIVSSKDLTSDKIAQVQNIISREMKAEIENIHISNKAE